MKAFKPLKIFCSYSHKDEDLLEELKNHLSGLEKIGLIEFWHDRQIPKGSDWDKQISNNLESANLILLLISSDFIASSYCMDLETKRALEKVEDGSAIAIPIFLRECSIDDLSFNKLQGTPCDRSWVNKQANRDGAWTEVVKDIRSAVYKYLGLADGIEERHQPRVALKKPKHSSLVYTIGILLPCIIVTLMIRFWFYPNDVNTINSRNLLSQGEYELARSQCLLAPWSAFRKSCLEVTKFSISKPESRSLFFNTLKEEGSEYAWMMMGDYRVSDYDGNNYDTLNRAYSDYETALRINPNLSQVYFGRGVIHHFKNRPLEAIPEYEAALKLAEDNRRFTLNLASAWADAGMYKRAIPLLYKIINEEGDVLMAYAELLEALLEEGDASEARRVAFRANILLDQESDLQEVQLNKAEWFVMQKGLPAFIQKWPEKLFYLDFVFKKAL